MSQPIWSGFIQRWVWRLPNLWSASQIPVHRSTVWMRFRNRTIWAVVYISLNVRWNNCKIWWINWRTHPNAWTSWPRLDQTNVRAKNGGISPIWDRWFRHVTSMKETVNETRYAVLRRCNRPHHAPLILNREHYLRTSVMRLWQNLFLFRCQDYCVSGHGLLILSWLHRSNHLTVLRDVLTWMHMTAQPTVVSLGQGSCLLFLFVSSMLQSYCAMRSYM